MPVAVALGAKSMGLSLDEFVKKVASGQIASKEFIQGFASELRKSVRDTGALAASLDSVRTARARMSATFDIGVFAGFNEAATGLRMFFNSVGGLLVDNQSGFRLLGETVGLFFKGITIGIEIIKPIFSVFLGLLEHFRQMMDDAFNVDIASYELSTLGSLMRDFGIIALKILSKIIWVFEKLDEVIKNIAGKDQSTGVTSLMDAFSLLMASGILLWMTSLVFKFTGMALAIGGIAKSMGFISKIAGSKGKGKDKKTEWNPVTGVTDVVGTGLLMSGNLYAMILGGALLGAGALDLFSENSSIGSGASEMYDTISKNLWSGGAADAPARDINMNFSGTLPAGVAVDITGSALSPSDEMKIGG